MTPHQFIALKGWITAEARAAVARRTYKNDRAIQEVESKAAQAEFVARELLVDKETP